ncbi:hypothetical protein B0H16DRAFT_1719752 [Mycena metata]|uniref:Uncharacterized protein n=1 Tax=Mycena metata TaxID=1033252 RepID=A0AAD7NHL5_9AGAR|nr:hypothetical protein B0H16DRAFT_1719752 [Mycena metata]
MPALTAEERERYSRELAEYTMRQFAAARKTLDSHKLAAAKLPALHAARDGSLAGRKVPTYTTSDRADVVSPRLCLLLLRLRLSSA